MGKKLTKRDIDAFTYTGGWDVRWDISPPGFGVRIYPSGKKAFVLSYRHKNRKRLLTVGQTSKITLDKARDNALKHLATLADKVDPLDERKRTRTGNTVEKIFADFLERYAKPKNRSWRETERIFKSDILPVIGKQLIQDVSKQDIIRLVDKISDRGSLTMANRTLAHVRKFFNWCVGRDLIQTSPVFKIPKPAPEVSRDRVLDDNEIKTIWNACEDIGYPFGPLVKTALLTAQRRTEVATMRWQDINEKEKCWVLPAESAKNKRRHEVPLSDAVLSLLHSLPRHNNGIYIFSTDGQYAFSNFGKAKANLDCLIQHQMPEWRLHDLRRTAASGMASLGAAPHVVERILNHVTGVISGVAAVYNRYDYKDEARQALNLWADKVEKLTHK